MSSPTQPLVSFIMPMHNAARFVAAAARSVFAQTLPSLELLVIDDASTDDGAEIVRSIDDSRLRLLRSDTQLNAAGARNLGLAEAQGEFIAFLDADDVATPSRIARQLEVLCKRREIAILGSRVALIDEGGGPRGDAFPTRSAAEIPATLLFENCLALSSVMMRRSARPVFRGEFAPAEDYELWARLSGNGHGIGIHPDPLTRYRIHPASVSARQPERMTAATAAVHAAQLDRLGFREAPPIHALLARWPLEPTRGQLAQAEAWLLALAAANDRRAIYPLAVFHRVVAARWFQLCLDSWLLGWPVWEIYHCSTLCAPTMVRRARLLRRLLPQRFRDR